MRTRFSFNDTATTEIYTLSLHDALPIYRGKQAVCVSRLCFPLRVYYVCEVIYGHRESFRAVCRRHSCSATAHFCFPLKHRCRMPGSALVLQTWLRHVG